MQLDFFANLKRPRISKPGCVLIGSDLVPLEMIRHQQARRYVLRVRRDGSVRVTIPRGGSIAFALDFARKNTAWIARQLEQRRAEVRPQVWANGTEILLRGESVVLTSETDGEVRVVRFSDHSITVDLTTTDLRPSVQRYLWSLAEKELPPRTFQLAAQHQLTVRRVMVRNQRSRWGSCSPSGTISLNWRLIHAPPAVRDYLILHELMHLREMNHSKGFWRLVEAACPAYADAETWLDAHVSLLR